MGRSCRRKNRNDSAAILTLKPPASFRFVLIGALSLIPGWRTLAATFELAWRDDQYTHILLILPIAASLIYINRRFLRSKFEPDPLRGSALLVLAIFAAGISTVLSASLRPDLRLSINMLALVIWWIGAFVLSFGTRISRAFLFPLLFSLGLVPAPQLALNEMIGLLQQGSALTARALFAVVGVPVVQNGVMLAIPGLTIEVAKECSSIRSSSMLLVTSMVLAQLVLRSPLRKALVVAIAVPLSVAKNGLRIFTIVMLGTRVNPAFLNGSLHRQGGIVFFLISLAALGLLLWSLQRMENCRTLQLPNPPGTLSAEPVVPAAHAPVAAQTGR